MIAGLAALPLLGVPAAGFPYSATATISVTIGGNGGQDTTGGIGTSTPRSAYSDLGWASGGVNILTSMSDSLFFSNLGGYNLRAYYNNDLPRLRSARRWLLRMGH
jgi:hypothetical protein